jgi:hypothetical protein
MSSYDLIVAGAGIAGLYDLIVAGAGIAGLYVATQYLRAHPTHRVLVVERNRMLGGRVSTHHPTVNKTKFQLEAGAGRIPISHKKVIGLIKQYGLTFQPWYPPKALVDPFPDLAAAYLPPLTRLPPAVLATNTLDVLLERVYGKEIADSFICTFPYWAEMRTLRADVALEAFLQGPLGEQSKGTEGAERREGPQGREAKGSRPAGPRWGGCAEGLSALTDRMGEDVKERGGAIRLQTSFVEVTYRRDKGVEVCIQAKDQKEGEWLVCKKLVVALDATSLRHVKGLGNRLPVLRHLKAEPLLRVYAVFGLVPPSKSSLDKRGSMLPVQAASPQGGDESAKGKPWFNGMAKVVVPTPIRFFIPMDESKGVAMISYTEGQDALYWMRMKDKRKREAALMAALRKTFPDREIPDPLAIFFYGWEQGCTYWTPAPKGTASASPYSVEEASAQSVQPFPGVPLYLCGESFAVQQSWMESALVQAEKVLGRVLGVFK